MKCPHCSQQLSAGEYRNLQRTAAAEAKRPKGRKLNPRARKRIVEAVANGMKQRVLAEHYGVSRALISLIVAGKR